MADRIEKTSMSRDEWNSLGPLFRPEEPDTGSDDYYDGTRREQSRTPLYPHAYLGFACQSLRSPNYSKRRDSFTNAQDQYTHIMLTLEKGGREAAKLVREVAREANKITTISDRMIGNPNGWVSLANDEGTAKVQRDFATTLLTFFPPEKGVQRQELPSREEDFDFAAISQAMKAHEPRRFRKRILQEGFTRFHDPDPAEQASDRDHRKLVETNTGRISTGKGKSTIYAGELAVFADSGMEEAAADYVANVDSRLLVTLDKNWGLRKAVDAVRPQGMFNPIECDVKGKVNQNKIIDQICSRVDGGVFFWNGDHNSHAFRALAEFSRNGKALKVFDATGAEVALLPTIAEAQLAHASKRDYALSQTEFGFDKSANEPQVRYGLELVKSFTHGSFAPADIRKIAQTGETINDLTLKAMDPEGREELRYAHSLSGTALNILADEIAIKQGAANYVRAMGEINSAGVTVLGREDFPATLQESGDVPLYLFAEGNIDAFKNAGTTLGVIGSIIPDDRSREHTENAHARKLVEADTRKALSLLADQPVTLAYIAGATPVEVPVTGPQIVIFNGGAKHLSKREAELKAKVLQNGGVVLYTKAPENSAYYYDEKAFNPDTGKKGMTVGVPSKGDHISGRRAAALLAGISNTLLVTNMDVDSKSMAHAAVAKAIEINQFAETVTNGEVINARTPAVLNFTKFDLKPLAGGAALLRSTGANALTRAGFGPDVSETLGKALEGRKPAGDLGQNLEIAIPNIVRHMNGKEVVLPQKAKSREAEATI